MIKTNFKQFISLALLLGLGLLSGLAQAGLTPGNTMLTNTATLTYTGGTVSDSVTVTVATIGAAPLLTIPADANRSEGQVYEGIYTLTAQNNGVDTYAIAFDVGPTGVTTSGTYDAPSLYSAAGGGAALTTPIELGASAILSLVSTTVFTVPSDGTIDSVVNGLEGGDTIVIDSITYTIASVVDNGTLVNGIPSATITVGTALAGGAVVGVEVYEIKTFYVRSGDVGTLSSPPTAGVITVSLDVTPTLTGTLLDGASFAINVVEVKITKYVRNVTSANCIDSNNTSTYPVPPIGAGDCAAAANLLTIGSNTWYRANASTVRVIASADSTVVTPDTLEYLIRVETSAAGLADAKIVDELPPFTTYTPSTTKIYKDDLTHTSGPAAIAGATFPFVTATAIDSDGVSGVVGANKTVDIVYQVTLQ